MIALGGVISLMSYGSALKVGPDLLCQERADTVPSDLEGSPYTHLREAQLRALPVELTCRWDIAGQAVTTRAMIDPVEDVVSGIALGTGIAALLASAATASRPARSDRSNLQARDTVPEESGRQ
ncbi:hypothetical protein SAMN04488554_0763 [Ruania alba]|uniref:Uncharacterized protein n=2 Tax=Ruania alba TaxID=648782 RepID=A0A1H5DQX4_9MICO|nr:hypothetical protein SAMN04488554_0763 [Ruania alba]